MVEPIAHVRFFLKVADSRACKNVRMNVVWARITHIYPFDGAYYSRIARSEPTLTPIKRERSASQLAETE